VEVGIVVEDLGGGPGEEPVAAILFHLGGGTEVFRELGFVFAEIGEEDAEEGVLLLFGFGEVPAGAGEEFEDGVDEFDAAFRFVGAALDLFDQGFEELLGAVEGDDAGIGERGSGEGAVLFGAGGGELEKLLLEGVVGGVGGGLEGKAGLSLAEGASQ
jgi:hypothetical protein